MGPYIIMEYLENGTLESFLETIQGSSPLPQEFLLYIFLCCKYSHYMKKGLITLNEDHYLMQLKWFVHVSIWLTTVVTFHNHKMPVPLL